MLRREQKVLPWRKLAGRRPDARVLPATRLSYQVALNRFVTWCALQSLIVRNEWHLDGLLIDFAECVCEKRGELALLISALGFFYPRLKGALCMVIQYKRGWELGEGVVHTTPMLKVFVFAFARAFVQALRAKMAVGLLVQFDGLLRAGEMLSLRRKDIVLPEFQPHLPNPKAFVLLGFSRSTKVRRQQVAKISDPYVIAALRYVYVAAKSPTEKLFPFTYAQYYEALAATTTLLGLEGLRYTPHSPRAGKATQMSLEEVPFPTIQEDGRWASATSLRIYLDRAAALAQATVDKSLRFRHLVASPHLVGDIFRLRPVAARP